MPVWDDHRERTERVRWESLDRWILWAIIALVLIVVLYLTGGN